MANSWNMQHTSGLEQPSRVRWLPLTERIYVLLIVLTLPGSSIRALEESTGPCPSSCKCSAVEEPQSISGVTIQSDIGLVPLMARCWIPANMMYLPCSPNWTIVHLQILTGQALPDQIGPLHTEGSRTGPNRNIGYPNISVSSSLFEQCTSLTRLAIWERSQFTWLPQYWLRPLVNLERLFIQVPTLRTLPDHFLAFLPKLHFVKISKCAQLTRLTRAMFEPCPESLHTLWLDGNGLRFKLPAGVFLQCQLRVLHLNENQLSQLDWGSLSGLDQLTSLYLQRNQLTGSLEQTMGYRKDMASTALGSTPMLKILDLSFNKLTSIEGIQWSGQCTKSGRQQYRGLCYLEELDLSHNRLKWIGLDSFNGLPRLRKLNMDANPDLFASEGSTNLALVLYAISVVHKHIQSLIIPVHLPHTSSQRAKINGSINVCQLNANWLAHAPRYLSAVVSHVNQTSCSRLSMHDLELMQSTVTTPNLLITDSVTDLLVDSSIIDQSDGVDPIMAFVRQTNRLNLLALCLGLILVGLLIGLLPMTYFMCTARARRGKTRPGNSSNNISPLLVQHPSQDAGFFLGANLHNNSPNGSMTSPLPKRTMKNGRNMELPPIPPARVHFGPTRVPVLHGSADHIRARPVGQSGSRAVPSLAAGLPRASSTRITSTRRVNSTGNVYHRMRPQSGPINPSTTRPQYDQLASSTSSPVCRNTRSMLVQPNQMMSVPSNVTTAYCPTEETALDGSTYSLATLTSFQARSPVQPVFVSTERPAAV